MTGRLAMAVLILPLSCGVVFAEGATRPAPRPLATEPVTTAASDRPHPQPRPPIAQPTTTVPTPLRPKPRPVDLRAKPAATLAAAAPTQPARKTKASLTGAVCNNPAILGKALKPITSPIKGCNVAAPVLVTQVSGVTLNPAATINCKEATALATWVTKGLQPAFGGTIWQLNVVDSYVCRPRNNVRGAQISEHGTGNAIDISGFVTTGGRLYTVASNYNSQIRAAQRAACGTFHTTLGPGSDGYHENHIHLDVAPNQGGPYCH